MVFGFGPFGLSPFGLPDDLSGDLSVGDPFQAFLTDSQARRTFLVYARPKNFVTGEIVTVKLGDGFASQDNDTLPDAVHTPLPHALFRAGLLNPYYSTHRVMQSGQIIDNSSVSNPEAATGSGQEGEFVFELATGRLLPLKSYEWDAAQVQILLGRPESKLSEFGVLFDGVAGTVNSSNATECHVPLLDKSYRLSSYIINETYRGSGAALRGNGTDTYVSGTCLCPAGSMTVEIFVRPRTSAATQKDIVGWRNGSLAGQRELRFASGVLNNAPEVAIRNDSGAQFVVTASSLGSGVLEPHKMYHLAYILDVATLKLSLVVDLDFMTQQIYNGSISGTFNTVLSNLALLRTPDASANFADVDISEIRIHPRALTVDELNASRDLVLADPTICKSYYPINEGTGSTLFDTSGGGHNLTINGTAQWVGSLEGDATLAGQYPPLWEGINRQVEPVNVDSQNYVYEVTRNPESVNITVSSVSDKGAMTLTMDSPVSDIYDWTPVAGHCVISRMGTRTLLRLQNAPQGTLTVTVSTDTKDYASVVKRLAQVYPLPSNRLTDDEVDLVAFAQMTFKYPMAIEIGLRNSNRTIWDLIQEIAKKSGAWAIFTRRGMLTTRVLEAPSVPKFRLTENDVQASAVTMIAKTLAAKRTTLKYRNYSTTQDPTALSTSLSPAAVADLGKASRSLSTPIDTGVLAVRPAAQDLVLETLYDDPAEVYPEAVRRQLLWGVNRATYELPLTRGTYQYEIGDEFEANIQAANGSYVENLQAALLVIVARTEDANQNTVLEAWGLDYEYTYIATEDEEVLITDSGEFLAVD